MSPLSNAFVKPDALDRMERFYPLHAYVCDVCRLVQLEQFASPEEIFDDYAYFSSYSQSWLRHCEAYTDQMIQRFGLGGQHQVVEIASNDGYLLKYFKAAGVPVLGIEPADNVAKVAQALTPWSNFSVLKPLPIWPPAAHALTCCWATTCWPMCLTSTTLFEE
jgi:hypothetical protein